MSCRITRTLIVHILEHLTSLDDTSPRCSNDETAFAFEPHSVDLLNLA
jgi:hypothetical protein